MSTTGPYRLKVGGQIDRTKEISFRFDGRTLTGHPGDTLASALLANGVRTVARSFKLHRPRGIFSCDIEEPSALVQLGEGAHMLPSCRAPTTELHEGLEARSQEGWPGVRFDLGRLLDFTASLWSAGFYNKTFIWPQWRTYEGIIRRLAGLGRAPTEPDPDRYEVANLHCDTLVVGGGRSGLCAAREAAHAGARVVLAEQQSTLGGHSIWDGASGDQPGSTWVFGSELELVRLGARVLVRTAAVGYYDHDVVVLLQQMPHGLAGLPRERLWIVRAQRLVLATGTIEQPLVFDHNDRPGIMLAGAARQYLRRYGVAVGRRVLVATNNDSAYSLATDLRDAGVTVLALVDSRRESAVPEMLRQALRERGIEWIPQSLPVETTGFGALKSVSVGRLSLDERSVEAVRTFHCDALAVSGGFAPALHLYAQAGGKLAYDAVSGTIHPIPRTLETSARARSIEIVGSASQVIAAGPRVSLAGNTRRQWVDLAHDVTVADLELALRENYTSIEHVKRYTTVGMAADQGKTSHAAALEVVGRLRGVAPRDLGQTTLRPPVTPVTLGAIAGRELGERFAPVRRLPMHDWHATHRGILHDFGGWQRPVAYPKAGLTREQAAGREARAVRTACGLFDGSSLGKIEVQGPDALEFLDHFYINNLKTLQRDRVRYVLMLRDSGILFDDGTVVALAPDHLLLTTTSGNASRVYQLLEEWYQCEWPDLRVAITHVTEQWAVLSLAGPRARTILSKLEIDIDLSPSAFPHLTLRQGKLLGLPARVYRVSFTGELTYEINVPADSGREVWEALLEAGVTDGLEPFGMDALMTLRLEKGFVHIGTDTDGTSVPDDIGFGRIARNKAADFIGKRSLALPEHVRPERMQLVGLTSRKPFIIGSHLRVNRLPGATDGWITSAGISTVTGEAIALALLRAGRQYVGQEVTVYDAGAPIGRACVVMPPFYDPTGQRMND